LELGVEILVDERFFVVLLARENWLFRKSIQDSEASVYSEVGHARYGRLLHRQECSDVVAIIRNNEPANFLIQDESPDGFGQNDWVNIEKADDGFLTIQILYLVNVESERRYFSANVCIPLSCIESIAF
jgi:hypothetical protein